MVKLSIAIPVSPKEIIWIVNLGWLQQIKASLNLYHFDHFIVNGGLQLFSQTIVQLENWFFQTECVCLLRQKNKNLSKSQIFLVQVSQQKIPFI